MPKQDTSWITNDDLMTFPTTLSKEEEEKLLKELMDRLLPMLEELKNER